MMWAVEHHDGEVDMSAQRIDYREAQLRQPEALVRVAAHVAGQLASRTVPDLSTLVAGAVPVFLGMGASCAAAALPVALLNAGGRPSVREIASETDQATDRTGTVAIAVSQSGRSPETIEALRTFPVRWAVVNVAGSSLAEVAGDLAVDLGSEPDSYASTIGYTGTLVGLTILARATLGTDPLVAASEWDGIDRLVESLEADQAAPLRALADAAATITSVDVVAAGASRAASEAGALLLREVCRIPSAAVVTRNYLHGEMESAGGTLHVVIGDGREVRLAHTLADAGHPTLLVTTQDVEPAGHLRVVRLPAVSEPVRVVLETVVLQRLASSFADARGVAIEDFVFEHDDTKVTDATGTSGPPPLVGASASFADGVAGRER
ncbi:fructoselysine-6-P-deglycase FrlB-like protein [Oerskovia enterophila]